RAENAAAADDRGPQEGGRNGGGARDRPHEDRGSGLATRRRPGLYPGAPADARLHPLLPCAIWLRGSVRHRMRRHGWSARRSCRGRVRPDRRGIRIAERLLTGRTPAEIARDLALAMSTVRSHLASIFAKTGTSRQGDFVRLATQLAAPIGRVTPAESSQRLALLHGSLSVPAKTILHS